MNKIDNHSTLMERLFELWTNSGCPTSGIPKAILIDPDILQTPDTQLTKDSSLDLFARLIFALTNDKQDKPIARGKLKLVFPLIDPDMKALVTQETVQRIFHLPASALHAYRDLGLLSFTQRDQRYLYEWEQIRELFGNSNRNARDI